MKYFFYFLLGVHEGGVPIDDAESIPIVEVLLHYGLEVFDDLLIFILDGGPSFLIVLTVFGVTRRAHDGLRCT